MPTWATLKSQFGLRYWHFEAERLQDEQCAFHGVAEREKLASVSDVGVDADGCLQVPEWPFGVLIRADGADNAVTLCHETRTETFGVQKGDLLLLTQECKVKVEAPALFFVSGRKTQPEPPQTEAIVLNDRARALAHYPHARRCNGMLYLSGTSSRRPDNTHVGAELVDGEWKLDIEAQTRQLIENLRIMLNAAGADWEHVVDIT
ncbi:MAG: hypothetical protein MHM6MM_008896, partial [Cercozoa sp. M6MM]